MMTTRQLQDEILRLKKEKDICILAHAYQSHEILEVADYTGEGRLDFQTAMGKAPVGVAKLAKKHHAKVIAFAGSVTKEAAACNKEGIDAFFPILRNVCTLAEAMDPATAKNNMTATAEQVFRLL